MDKKVEWYLSFFYQNGFRFYEREKKTIVVDEAKIQSYVDYINENQIKVVAVNSLYYHKNDLTFLEQCPHVEEVHINSIFITDHSKLYSLKNLQVLSIEEPKMELDLSVFSNTLKELSIEHNRYVKKLETCTNLHTLMIWKYKPKSKNLEELKSLKQVKDLSIIQGNINSLKGCRSFQKLTKLEVHYLRNLKHIDEIENNSMTIKSVEFGHCRNLKNHGYVVCLKELETLIFESCGDIQNLQFVKALTKLTHLSFVDCNIVDGNIKPCIGLNFVGFNNKRHYNHTFEELNPNFKVN
ncbi:hypothetical protein ACFFHM_07785 [Halalkalibacter kiskunsagensis]|uniref:Leucine-rich repeat domain-containing protein n=1 Tax=Halalkalibacter kiskunsagensis TaxID=1548599 RepID=A0ABV6KAT4_9BACI